MGIREATLADTPALMELYDGSLRYMASPQPTVWRVVPQSPEFAQNAVIDPNASLLVWDENGALLGLAAVFLHEAEEKPIRFASRYADLDTLFVRPAFRGRGIGTALLHAAKQWAVLQGCNHLELMTLGENSAARQFYANHGMKERNIILWTSLPDRQD